MGSEEQQIQVLFGTRAALGAPALANSVLIVPTDDHWNDFGYRTKIDIRVHMEGKEYGYNGAGFIGFIVSSPDESNGAKRLQELLVGIGEFVLPVNPTHRFFTMLPDMEAYRSIVRDLGLDTAVEVLTAMRELVAISEFKRSATNWLDAATASDVFSKSFVRNAEAYFAFKNAGPILRGLDQEEFHNVSKAISIHFQLAGRKNPHALTFQFDHGAELPKRIAVVIGKNGVGKSQTLGRIVRAALEGDGSLTDATNGTRVLFNRILAFAPTNEAGSVFPTNRRKRPRIWYRRFSLNRSGSLRSGEGVADQILQIARSAEHIGRLSRWEIFLRAIGAIDMWQQLCLPQRDKLRMPLPLKTLRDGGERVVLENFAAVDSRAEPVRVIEGVGYPLSSGEISFLRFAAQASLFVENGSLLLLDEPETHLHPNFISQFVMLLDRLLELTGSGAIIATHSAYFVREVFHDQVTILRQDEEGNIKAESPALRTFGADVGAISYFVFGEDESSRLASKVEGRLLEEFNTWDQLYATYKDELSLEMLGDLRSSLEARKAP